MSEESFFEMVEKLPDAGGPDVSAPSRCESCGTERAIIFKQAKDAILAADRKVIAGLLRTAMKGEPGDERCDLNERLDDLRDALAEGLLPETGKEGA